MVYCQAAASSTKGEDSLPLYTRVAQSCQDAYLLGRLEDKPPENHL